MNVVALLDEIRREIDVLEHPFYARWRAGELTRDELALYAGEYRHAVRALAEASVSAARDAPSLERHAAEETSHVDLWEQFAGSLEASERTPLAESTECAQAWIAGEDLLERLAVLYAIEASQPAIAQTKLEGLVGHYGFTAEGPATEYFRLHATLDTEHAAQERALIEQLPTDRAAAERMTRRAQDALTGYWRLLDGVVVSST